MVLGGRDVTGEPLRARRELLEKRILPNLAEPARYVGLLDSPLSTLIESVKADGLEGLVAKRLDSGYEPGTAIRRLAEDARQPRAGVRDRRLHRGGTPFDALISGTTEGRAGLRQVARLSLGVGRTGSRTPTEVPTSPTVIRDRTLSTARTIPESVPHRCHAAH